MNPLRNKFSRKRSRAATDVWMRRVGYSDRKPIPNLHAKRYSMVDTCRLAGSVPGGRLHVLQKRIRYDRMMEE